jgi:two-component system sensor histidine kinase BarA
MAALAAALGYLCARCLASGAGTAGLIALSGFAVAAAATGFLGGRLSVPRSGCSGTSSRDAAATERADAETLAEKLRALEARNAELERVWRQAEARMEVKARFLAQMSHEMRTPMNGILGFAELLGKTPLAEYQLEKLRLIERSAKWLLDMINEILDLAKIEAEKFGMKPELFPLRRCVEDTAALLAPGAKVPIVLCVEPDVPAALFGDPVRLQQVLTNLIGNAAKFTRAGRIAVRVRRLPGSKPGLLFSVSDTGRGIAAESLGELFSPFSQLGECAPNGERGTGLGLSIAMSIVERAGGRIGVVSKPGKGSTFWFTHPLAEDLPVQVSPSASKAVVVDPDPLSRKALRYQLESLGVRVRSFASLEEFAGFHGEEGESVFVGTLHHRTQEEGFAQMIEQVKAAGARPVLVLPHFSRRVLEYCQAQGAACLWQPVASDALSEILSARPAGPATAAVELPPEALKGKTLLVVDDHEINRRLLGTRLSKLGARVMQAGNGPKALAYLRARPFDLVFLDLRMPRMGGVDILRELFLGEISHNHHAPFIAVTAHFEEEQRVSIVQAGFADFLVKPVPEGALFRMLAKYLDIEPLADPAPAVPDAPTDYAAAFLERSGGNRALAQTLARKLAGELQTHSQGIGAALEAGDFAKARDFAHGINGSAAFCGLAGIRSGAAALEQALLQSAPPATLDRLALRLDGEIDRFLEEKERLFSALGAPEIESRLPMLG